MHEEELTTKRGKFEVKISLESLYLLGSSHPQVLLGSTPGPVIHIGVWMTGMAPLIHEYLWMYGAAQLSTCSSGQLVPFQSYTHLCGSLGRVW